MKTTNTKFNRAIVTTIALGGAGIAGYLVYRALRAKPESEKEFTASYPRNTGAISAVTGGDPEDINAMPATEDPRREGPIYDGSQL